MFVGQSVLELGIASKACLQVCNYFMLCNSCLLGRHCIEFQISRPPPKKKVVYESQNLRISDILAFVLFCFFFFSSPSHFPFIYISNIYLYVCLCLCRHVRGEMTAWESQFFPLCKSWELNSSHHKAWWQVLLPAEPSLHSSINLSI